MDEQPKRYLEEATPGIWFVGACRTWTEEQRVITAIPLLMELYAECSRSVEKGTASADLVRAVTAVKLVFDH